MALIYRVSSKFCSLLNTFYCKCTINVIRFKSNGDVTRRGNAYARNIKINDAESFHDKISYRRRQAEKSILVQIDSCHSISDCNTFCSKYGEIVAVYHYSSYRSNHAEFLLIQFQSKDSVYKITQSAGSRCTSEYIPVHTSMLWLRNKLIPKDYISSSPLSETSNIKKYTLHYPSDDFISSKLNSLSTTEQMRKLYRTLKCTDVDIRLRFFTAYQLELCFSKLFPTISVIPFGSSVTGFGQIGCDLDLVCKFDTNQTNDINSKLMYLMKPYSYASREEQQQFLLILSDVMHKFIPGISNVTKVLQARVPIIKFIHIYTNMQCDLSCTGVSGLYMSELLYVYGEIDVRVKPLVCTIRKWAERNRITNENPGGWITNFSLTLLVIFYLQIKNVLPSVNAMKHYIKLASYSTFNKDFILEMQNVYSSSTTRMSLSSLLYDFFLYYATFNFKTDGICIREGKIQKKLNVDSPIYIYNPYDPALNVSRNVTVNELMHMVQEFRKAMLIMEQNTNHTIIKLVKLIPRSEKHRTADNGYTNKNSNKVKHNKQENNKINIVSKNSNSNNEELSTEETNLKKVNKMTDIIKLTNTNDSPNAFCHTSKYTLRRSPEFLRSGLSNVFNERKNKAMKGQSIMG